MKKSILPLALLIVCMLLSYSMFSQSYYSCDRWGYYETDGYTIYNNIWGENYGTQCLTVYSYDDWYVEAYHSNTSGIKSYPNVEMQMDVDVDDMETITSTFAVSRPSSGSYSSTYDIWFDDYAYEVMLWMNYTGDIGPIATSWDANGDAVAEETNVTVGGHTWNVYKGSNGYNDVFSFLRTSNTNSGTVDISAISQWLRDNDWFDNANLHSVQFGFEITTTSGTGTFQVTDFDVTESSSSSSGSTVTNATVNGTYCLIASHSTKAVDTYAWGTTDGTNICQWTYWGGACQQFIITQIEDVWHRITPSIATDQAIDVYGISTEDGANINTWEYWGGYGQQFRFQNAGTGVYRIINRNSEKCLDVEGASTDDGANIIQWTCTSGSTNQMFQLVSASDAEKNQLSENACDFVVYPNPATECVNIRIPEELDNASIEIINKLGQVVSKINNVSSGVNALDINMMSSGIYLVRITKGADVLTKVLLVN